MGTSWSARSRRWPTRALRARSMSRNAFAVRRAASGSRSGPSTNSATTTTISQWIGEKAPSKGIDSALGIGVVGAGIWLLVLDTLAELLGGLSKRSSQLGE